MVHSWPLFQKPWLTEKQNRKAGPVNGQHTQNLHKSPTCRRATAKHQRRLCACISLASHDCLLCVPMPLPEWDLGHQFHLRMSVCWAGWSKLDASFPWVELELMPKINGYQWSRGITRCFWVERNGGVFPRLKLNSFPWHRRLVKGMGFTKCLKQPMWRNPTTKSTSLAVQSSNLETKIKTSTVVMPQSKLGATWFALWWTNVTMEQIGQWTLWNTLIT